MLGPSFFQGDKAKPLVSWAGGFAVNHVRSAVFDVSANQDIQHSRADLLTHLPPGVQQTLA
jgi:hypothetical protein